MFKILVLFSVSGAMKFKFLSQGHIWTPNAGKHCIKNILLSPLLQLMVF